MNDFDDFKRKRRIFRRQLQILFNFLAVLCLILVIGKVFKLETKPIALINILLVAAILGFAAYKFLKWVERKSSEDFQRMVEEDPEEMRRKIEKDPFG